MSHKLSPGAVEVSLPEILENRLKSYSMAAAAAGVGLLALAHPADAEVVITHKVIQVTNSTVSIDINHDGIADFQFGLYSSENGYFFGGNATIKPLVSGGVVGGAELHSPSLKLSGSNLPGRQAPTLPGLFVIEYPCPTPF